MNDLHGAGANYAQELHRLGTLGEDDLSGRVKFNLHRAAQKLHCRRVKLIEGRIPAQELNDVGYDRHLDLPTRVYVNALFCDFGTLDEGTSATTPGAMTTRVPSFEWTRTRRASRRARGQLSSHQFTEIHHLHLSLRLAAA